MRISQFKSKKIQTRSQKNQGYCNSLSTQIIDESTISTADMEDMLTFCSTIEYKATISKDTNTPQPSKITKKIEKTPKVTQKSLKPVQNIRKTSKNTIKQQKQQKIIQKNQQNLQKNQQKNQQKQQQNQQKKQKSQLLSDIYSNFAKESKLPLFQKYEQYIENLQQQKSKYFEDEFNNKICYEEDQTQILSRNLFTPRVVNVEDLEIIKLRNSDGTKTIRYQCFRDSDLMMPSDLRELEIKQTQDDDKLSVQEDVDDAVKYVQNSLFEAVQDQKRYYGRY